MAGTEQGGIVKLFVQSTRPGHEDKKFEILEFNPETKKGVLIGAMNVRFDADLSKEALLKDGYKVVKEE